MSKEQLLILCENPLFAEGLLSILRREKTLAIEGSVSRRENGWRLIETLRPEVVIIEGSDPMVDASTALSELLRHSGKGHVISVNLNHREAVLYIGLQLAATESNLIKAVKAQVCGVF